MSEPHDHQITEQGREFLAAVEYNLKGIEGFSVGACKGCDGCELGDDPTDDEYEAANEGSSFSRASCDSCGSSLGGSRDPAHFIHEGEIVHCGVCVDCLLFHANGDVPEVWR